jgi:hypothetical protein
MNKKTTIQKIKNQVPVCNKCGKKYKIVRLTPYRNYFIPNCNCDELEIKISKDILKLIMQLAHDGSEARDLATTLVKWKKPSEKSFNYVIHRSIFEYLAGFITNQTDLNYPDFINRVDGHTELHSLVDREVREHSGEDLDYIVKRTVKIGRFKLRLPWRVVERKSATKECKFCGMKYIERTMYFGRFPFTYSIRPDCLCGHRTKLRLWKWQIPYILGAMNLGTYLESLCVDLLHSDGSSVDGHMADYEIKVARIADLIKEQTGINEEIGGYGDYVDVVTEIREMVRKKCNQYRKEWEEYMEAESKSWKKEDLV